MKVKQIHGHGNHLIFDGFSEGDIGNVDFIREFLMDLTDEIKMNAISKPFVLSHDAEDENESGITGVIVLAESNITIHTYPKKKWFCLDIYSCKEFDTDETVKFLINKLNISNYKKQILKRGFY